MRNSVASQEDLKFKDAFEAGRVSPADFNHLAHLRLAYVYLCQGDLRYAERKMCEALLGFLEANDIAGEKFHETLTRAWVMAVAHFMNRRSSSSFSDFSFSSLPLQDSKVMLTHYSAAALFSDRARKAFVEPDLDAIPC